MLSVKDTFDGDYVRNEYIAAFKRIAEVKCRSFHWSFEHIDNQVRDAIRYRFDAGHVIWYIPTENQEERLFVSTEKVKQFLLRHLEKAKK
jgi:hypothetical protein